MNIYYNIGSQSPKYYFILSKNVTYPLSSDDNGVKVKPEHMEKEKLYHCIFKDKVLLFFKDEDDILNCYEIEENELVEKVKASSNNDAVQKILEEYIEQKNLKH